MASVRALIVNPEGRFLLLQRGPTISRAGQWCLPGGRIQSGERPEDAVIRETLEEAGLHVGILNPLRLVGSCHYFQCQIDPLEQSIVLHPLECQNYIWAQSRRLSEVGAIMDYRVLRQILRDLRI